MCIFAHFMIIQSIQKNKNKNKIGPNNNETVQLK
jgi:hypothetical protein